jgi:hypothetical protein
MKKPRTKKPKKLTAEQEKIVEQATEQYADIIVRLIDEQNAAKRAENVDPPSCGS